MLDNTQGKTQDKTRQDMTITRQAQDKTITRQDNRNTRQHKDNTRQDKDMPSHKTTRQSQDKGIVIPIQNYQFLPARQIARPDRPISTELG